MRTRTHTYVRNVWGPWLLYDNESDPYQQTNLLGAPGAEALEAKLEAVLSGWLSRLGDGFEPGAVLLERAGLSHFWEANVPWGDWPTPFSQEPFMEPAAAAAAGKPADDILASAGLAKPRL